MKLLTKILTGLLSFLMLMPGGMKLMMAKDKLLLDPNMAWAEDFSPLIIKTIGGLEILAFLGLLLPYFTKLSKKIRLAAATGSAFTMIGAIIVHVGRNESVMIQPIILLLAITVGFLTYKETKA